MSRTPPDGASTSAAPLHPEQHHFTSTDLGLLLMAVIWGVNFTVIKAGISVMPFMAFKQSAPCSS